MLRQWTYKSHYYPGLTPADADKWQTHSDHCLDVLRSAAMCHGDTTLTTFWWKAGMERPLLGNEKVSHQCVDWDGLVESVDGRVVGPGEMRGMVNPILTEEGGGGEEAEAEAE